MDDNEKEYRIYSYPDNTEQVKLRLKTTFDKISPKFWDNSGKNLLGGIFDLSVIMI